MIASASTELENALSELAAYATATKVRYFDGNNPHGVSGVIGTENVVARAALNALGSMNARLEVVAAILSVSVSKALCAEFEKLTPGIRRAAGMRNDVVHSEWAIVESKPDDILSLTGEPMAYMRYTPKDLDVILSRIARERFAVQRFTHDCFASLGTQSQPPASPQPRQAIQTAAYREFLDQSVRDRSDGRPQPPHRFQVK